MQEDLYSVVDAYKSNYPKLGKIKFIKKRQSFDQQFINEEDLPINKQI